MAKQLLGKEVVAALNERIMTDVAGLKEKGVTPTLGIVRVGEREDDLSYERGATKRCEKLGVAFEKFVFFNISPACGLAAGRFFLHYSKIKKTRPDPRRIDIPSAAEAFGRGGCD